MKQFNKKTLLWEENISNNEENINITQIRNDLINKKESFTENENYIIVENDNY